MSKTITSDGINTTIEYNGVKEVVSDGNYSANTPNVNKIHSESGIEFTANQLNIDIKGNEQETCYTKGVTCESSIKVVGNPDQFDGSNYRKLHNALCELSALVVQQGNDKKSLGFPSLPSLDFGRILENMSSSYPATTPPPTPHIANFKDAATFVADMAIWYTGYLSCDAVEMALNAGKTEVERQTLQAYENMKAEGKDLYDSVVEKGSSILDAITNFDFSSIFGSPATEDRDKEVSYNIDRKTLYTSTNTEYITELERKL